MGRRGRGEARRGHSMQLCAFGASQWRQWIRKTVDKYQTTGPGRRGEVEEREFQCQAVFLWVSVWGGIYRIALHLKHVSSQGRSPSWASSVWKRGYCLWLCVPGRSIQIWGRKAEIRQREERLGDLRKGMAREERRERPGRMFRDKRKRNSKSKTGGRRQQGRRR